MAWGGDVGDTHQWPASPASCILCVVAAVPDGLQRMFDGVPNGARDRPPLPVKRGGGAAEPLGMLVTSAQRESFLVGSFLQLPHRGPAPSGSPCWAAVRQVGGGAAVCSVSPPPDLFPCGLPRAPSTQACLPLCAFSSSPMCCPSVCACGVWCGVCVDGHRPSVQQPPTPSAMSQRLPEQDPRSLGGRLSICLFAGG